MNVQKVGFTAGRNDEVSKAERRGVAKPVSTSGVIDAIDATSRTRVNSISTNLTPRWTASRFSCRVSRELNRFVIPRNTVEKRVNIGVTFFLGTIVAGGGLMSPLAFVAAYVLFAFVVTLTSGTPFSRD